MNYKILKIITHFLKSKNIFFLIFIVTCFDKCVKSVQTIAYNLWKVNCLKSVKKICEISEKCYLKCL